MLLAHRDQKSWQAPTLVKIWVLLLLARRLMANVAGGEFRKRGVSEVLLKNESGRTTLRFLALPTESAGSGGAVGAGHVLEWIDRAAFACASAWSGSYCVTAYVGNVHFRRPVLVGELVEVRARVISTGRSSMQVLVTVRSASALGGPFAVATDCLLVLVAVDDQRRPRAVPPWIPRNLAELDLEDRAGRRVAVRARIRSLMSSQAFTGEGTTPRLQLRFLASPRDVNWGGSVHGGTVMRWIDEAAQACATSWTRRGTVAVYAGGIHFHRPIAIGDLVEVDARVIHSSARALHVATRVRSAPAAEWRESAAAPLTTESMTVAVVVGADGRASAVESIALRSSEDMRLDALARDLMALRAELDEIGVDDEAVAALAP